MIEKVQRFSKGKTVAVPSENPRGWNKEEAKLELTFLQMQERA